MTNSVVRPMLIGALAVALLASVGHDTANAGPILHTAPPPTTQPASDRLEAPFDDEAPGTTDTTVADDPATPGPPDDDEPGDDEGDETLARPGITAQIRDSGITEGTVALAVAVLLVVAIGSARFAGRTRRPTSVGAERLAGAPGPSPDRLAAEEPATDVAAAHAGARIPGVTADVATLDLLVDLGEALIDAGDAVGHIESTLHSLGRVFGIDGLGILILPNALVISVPGAGDVQAEVGTAGRRPLRLDQIDDVMHLVDAAERGAISPRNATAELARIRTSSHPYGPGLVRLGHVLASVGIALVLRGSWREVLLAVVLGAAVGEVRRVAARQGRSWQPFWPLLTAAAVSTAVFGAARVVDDLAVFPTLAAPLVMFLPGALLTTAVLELATGQIVSGAARAASGALQLLLLALGIVAGGSLVGIPSGDIRLVGTGLVAEVLPWIGVAAFGLGVAWFNGARPSTIGWILVAMYAAYAGQVIGGLFFGGALSAFFGAAVMTPVALLAARQPSGPTPLVTFLPGFWILVPGALGLEGVARIISEDGGALGTSALTTTIVSMVGISLGILFGLVLVARDPDRPWASKPTS